MRSTPNASGPNFYGLFVGINRFESDHIGNLASAVRDATALHALFEDNLGGTTKVLTDEQATTAALRGAVVDLQHQASDEDVVVFTFSGHGSDTHELITYDADLDDLPGTAIPLAELTELVSGIRAKHLLIVLDCCFSGGAGAKVLHAPRHPRGGAAGPLSTTALLNQIAGTGRLILTASTADQPAWEDPRIGHGYLTYFLLQALLNADGLDEGGQINLYDLLKYVTDRVRSSVSGAVAARQEPTLRGQWDGAVLWPVFTPGPRYSLLYPPAAATPVSRDISSLAGHGLPDALLAIWSAALPGLNQLQQDAINNAGLLKGENVLVMAPTSSGKTMIGELAALRATQLGGRSVFLLPTKALVNEQYERFKRLYGSAGIRVVRATGDYNDEVAALLRGQFDLAIFTYEKFSGLVLTHPYLLRLIGVVVVDEVQTIVDRGRGRELELLLTLIKTRRDEDIAPQIIVLSAVLGEVNGLDSWLEANLLQTTDRPVPLDEGVLTMDGRYRYHDATGTEQAEQLIPAQYLDPRAQTLLIPLVSKLVAEGQQVIIIRGERGSARGAAHYLARSLGLPAADAAINDLPTGDPTAAARDLRFALGAGVAFHTSDLSRDDRRVVEDYFRMPDSPIRVVVATTTLAQGVNMPAETVIMPELNRRTGPNQVTWYSVADYKNIAGRAGRLGLVDKGRAIVLAFDQATANNVWDQYVDGRPEDVLSTLLGDNLDLYTVVLRVAAIAAQRSADGSAESEDLIAILANSLAAHQARLRGSGEAFDPSSVSRVVGELTTAGFLEMIDGTRTKPTNLGAIVAGSALRVQSAVRVATVLRQLQPAQIRLETVLSLAQATTELDEYRLRVNSRGIRKELDSYLGWLNGRLPYPVMTALQNRATDHQVVAMRAKRAVACLLWVNGNPMSDIEYQVMRHLPNRDASGPIGGVVGRTRDVVDTILAMAGELHPTAPTAELEELLPIQLEVGIASGHARLVRAGAELRREDFIQLTAQGLLGWQDIAAASDERLLALIRHDADALATLRRAVQALDEPSGPSLDDLLGPPIADNEAASRSTT